MLTAQIDLKYVMFIHFKRFIMFSNKPQVNILNMYLHELNIYIYNSNNLQFIESETTSQPLFGVVLESRTPYYWLKLVFGSRGNSLCLLYPVLVPAEFTGRLVEPSLHTPCPVLVEVVVGDYIIVPNSHLLL